MRCFLSLPCAIVKYIVVQSSEHLYVEFHHKEGFVIKVSPGLCGPKLHSTRDLFWKIVATRRTALFQELGAGSSTEFDLISSEGRVRDTRSLLIKFCDDHAYPNALRITT